MNGSREAGYSVKAVVPYAASATRKGQGWLTMTNGLDNITLTDVTPRELDALGRAIRYAAAKLETLAAEKQQYTGHLPVASLPHQRDLVAGEVRSHRQSREEIEPAELGGEG